MKAPSQLSPQAYPAGLCATIGNFDGVHLGHRALIERALALADAEKRDFALITFWPHPREVLHSHHVPLASRAMRQQLLRECGARNIVEMPFTREFASLSAREFIEQFLKPANLRRIVVGHDFTLGHNREGDSATLLRLADENGFTVTRLPGVLIQGQLVSSSHLRKLIDEGKVAEAAILLGRPYSVEGIVEAGEARGRVLGFPTANLGGIATLLPADGVYATIAHLAGKTYTAVTNLGNNPTFNGSRKTVESFLLDASGDFYGKEMRLDFLERLRGEMKFDSPQALIHQINLDIAQARNIASRRA